MSFAPHPARLAWAKKMEAPLLTGACMRLRVASNLQSQRGPGACAVEGQRAF
ncbi:hypothetical protein [Sutterella seckii]|uniref:hypothetical protein n=1 Tax=Sutterella seckii TaxID=1944635 RepID=UPI00186A819A|nr:hypothetical protein [Sutterella seckii]